MPHKKTSALHLDQPHAVAVIPNASAWAMLTWDDLDQDFGSRSVQRGRSYQRGGQVNVSLTLAGLEDGTQADALSAAFAVVLRHAVSSSQGRRLESSLANCRDNSNLKRVPQATSADPHDMAEKLLQEAANPS